MTSGNNVLISDELRVDDDIPKVSNSSELQPSLSNEPSGDETLAHVNISEGYFALLDHFTYPFMFFFLLLLLLLGRRLYMSRR